VTPIGDVEPDEVKSRLYRELVDNRCGCCWCCIIDRGGAKENGSLPSIFPEVDAGPAPVENEEKNSLEVGIDGC
jgi:hypothetical protein